MGKCIAYTAGAVIFMGIGALVTGLTLYFTYPNVYSNLGNDIASAFQDNEMIYAKCDLKTADGLTSIGMLHLVQNSSSSWTTIRGNVESLSAGPHGFHIHEFGATSDSCKDAGGHYNPAELPHGGPDSAQRHVGDLGNIMSVGEAATIAVVEINDMQVKLAGDWSVVGRAVVIHAGEDDLGASGDSAGAAGSRVACCTIYTSKTA